MLAVVLLGLVLAFIAKPYAVPSASMEQALQPGDVVLVNRLAYVGSAPRTGDVVVFDADSTWGAQTAESPLRSALRWLGAVTGFGPTGQHTLIKRVIAGPGQTVRCCTAEGKIEVDGQALDEPYVTNDLPFAPGESDCATTPRSPRCFDAVTVPKDSYLVLGDNRSDSSDSAIACRTVTPTPTCWRWAHTDDLVGRAAVVLWPLGRWTGL